MKILSSTGIPNFFIKICETYENVRECMQNCMSYLLLIDCRHFALSRKNDQRNSI